MLFFQRCFFLMIVLFLGACSKKDLERNQKFIQQNHAPRVDAIVQEDFKSHALGIQKAAEWLGPYFKSEWDDVERERQIRFQLQKMQRPPKGISELVVSPISFLAVIDEKGVVIARDSEKDSMKGKDFSSRFPIVKRVLQQGGVETSLGEFEGSKPEEPSVSILFVSEIQREGKRVGAVMAGIPLWRLAQKLSRQLRAEHAKEINAGAALWVYLFKKDRFFHHGTPPEIFGVIEKERIVDQMKSLTEEGKVGAIHVHGRDFAWGAFSLSNIGEDVGVLIVRSSSIQ